MTTLSCLLAWLFLYIFAISSLSLCSINGNVREDTQDGLAIGQSEQNHLDEDPDLFQSETVIQDGENGQPSSQELSKEPPILEGNNILDDSFKDSVGDTNNVELESDEKIEGSLLTEDIERKGASSLADGEASHKSDLTPVNSEALDTERLAQVKLHNSEDDEGDSKVIIDQPEEETYEGEDEAEDQNDHNVNVGLTSNEGDKHERSGLDEDPSPEQTLTAEDKLVHSVNGFVQDKKLDDMGTEFVNRMTEDGVTSLADDTENQRSVEKVGTVREDREDTPTERLIGEKDVTKGTEVEGGEGKDESIIDQQMNKMDENRLKIEEGEEEMETNEDLTKEDRKTKEEKDESKEMNEEEKVDEEKKPKVETDEEKKPKVETDEEKKPKVETDEEKKPKVETDEEKKPKVETDEEKKSKVETDEEKPKVETDKEKPKVATEEVLKQMETDDKEETEHKETTLNVTDGDVIKTEEMPSYGEWREKKLQQAQEDFDRELGQSERNPLPAPKFNLNENSKNHASADCGAKILGNNPEAQSASAILNSNRDIYMINPCSAKSIWFTVELCEPIQVKLIELANYELFSCVPESFKVSISDRYPVREWHLLGTFVARDERSLQNFPLNEETMFAKYMKIEMLTFFGSEHFCPLSVLRVFGTSMVEEIDEAEDVNSGSATEQDVLPVHPTPLAEDLKGNGILDHAKDAVFKLVEKAAKVLTGSKSDTDVYTDNMTGATEEVVIEGSPADDVIKDEEPHGSYNDNFNDTHNDTHNDKCNGQEMCFQENYATISQHCCLSLFAQTAGSILLCCKALRRSPKSIKSDEETGEKTTKLPLASQLPIEVIQTKMDNIHVTLDGSIQTSIVLEPTPPETYHGMDEKIETSAPPVLILSTKALTELAKPGEDSQSDILATKSSTVQMLHTSAEQKRDVIDDVTGQTDTGSSHEEGKNSKQDISVVPIPPPRTENSFKEENSKEMSSSVDTSKDDNSTAVATKDAAPAPPDQTLKRSEREENIEPTNLASENDAVKSNAAQKNVSSSNQQKSIEAETKGNISEELKHTPLPRTADAKEQSAASKNISKNVQEEMNESLKVSPSSSLNEKSDNSKTAAAGDLGNGSFSPSASSLSSLGTLPHGTQKESVLMRLNNRIKTLEINMSLSGLYLEELSQRYRKQMDEMQKAFNTKIKNVQENAQKAQEVRQQQAEYIQQIEKQLEKVTTDLENVTLRMDGILREVVERHLFLMLCEVIIMVIIFTYCLRRTTSRSAHTIDSSVGMATTKSSRKKSVEDVGRRNSDGLLHVPMRDKISLSPGLEAGLGFLKDGANSKTGSLDDLLIIGPTTPLREALRQASEPSKQKNRNKNKGRHKNAQRPASATSNENIYQGASSSNSSIASTVSLTSTSNNKGLMGGTSSKHSTAGLLFKGSAEIKKGFQGGQSKQGNSSKGGNQQLQRSVPENVGHVNGSYEGNKSNGVGMNGYNGGGGKKNNQCFNGGGKR